MSTWAKLIAHSSGGLLSHCLSTVGMGGQYDGANVNCGLLEGSNRFRVLALHWRICNISIHIYRHAEILHAVNKSQWER